MTRGRKRRILGWGLVGIGVLLTLLIAASAWVFMAFTQPTWDILVTRGWLGMHWDRNGVGIGIPADVAPWYLSAESRPMLNWWHEWSIAPGNLNFGPLTIVSSAGPPFASIHIGVAMWVPAVAFLLAGGLLVNRGSRAAKRARSGLCPACGYDRSTLPPTTPCPECGPPTSPKVEAPPVRG